MARQLRFCGRFFEKELGVEQTVLDRSDCCGNLPEFLQDADIEQSVTSKESWCEYTQARDTICR
jgi:hypothetical protein